MIEHMTLQGLVAAYGYLAVLVGTFLEGEVILLLGGAAVHLGLLGMPGVVLAALVGSLAGDQVYFIAGRRYGRRLVARRPRWQAKVERAHDLVERFQTRLIISFRFLFGLRMVTPFVFGMGPVSTSRFVLLNGLGALLWSVVGATTGYLFGAAVDMVVKELPHVEAYLTASLAGLALLAAVSYRLFTRLRAGRIPEG